MSDPLALLSLTAIEQRFTSGSGLQRRTIRAVDGVSLQIRPGEVLGLVGESGCGKSTLGRIAVGLTAPASGEVRYRGQPIRQLHGDDWQQFRRRVQMVFQNPHASLSPRLRIEAQLLEPIRWHHPTASAAEHRQQLESLMAAVGIDTAWRQRYPHQLSGGQKQRIAIARALTTTPELIVADEPVSALDLSVQAQVLNLLLELRASRGMTYLFISHDLAVVRHIADRVAVMYLGTLCELAPAATLFSAPRHPYTQALLQAIPRLDRDRPNPPRLAAELPNPGTTLIGCPFHSRCPQAQALCRQQRPALRQIAAEHQVACHLLE